MTLFRVRYGIVRSGFLSGLLTAGALAFSAVAAEWRPERLAPAEPRRLAPGPAQPLGASERPLNSRAKAGILVRNPNARAGEPEFALLDSYGRVQRLVEGSTRIPMDQYVGRQVRIAHDTGKTLLASQLEFPLRRTSNVRGGAQPAAYNGPLRRRGVRLAAEQSVAGQKAPIVLEETLSAAEKQGMLPMPASEGAMSTSNGPMSIEQLPPMEGGMSHESYASDGMAGPMMQGGESYCPECQMRHANGMHNNMPAGEFVEEEFMPYGEECSSCEGGSCGMPYGDCGDEWCGGGCAACSRRSGCNDYLSCGPGSRGRFYGRVEYLLWWFDGMDVPPLVTGSTVQGNEGVIGLPGTTILYGGNEILGGSRNGLRFWAGMYLDQKRDIALEADYFFFETETESFTAGGEDGNPIVGRPFFDLVPVVDPDADPIVFGRPQERAEQVNFPGGLEGDVNVTTRSEFEGLGIHLRGGICCKEMCQPCGCSECCGQVGGGGGGRRGVSRIDFLAGYRYLRLAESINIVEDLNQIDTPANTFIVHDGFSTSNVFHGGDLGFQWGWEYPVWGFEVLSKLAIGSNRQRVHINGSTTFGDAPNTPAVGGLLAQSSNIGTYERNRFAVVPEIGARTFFRISPRCRLTAGYTLIYFSNVVRPGDHIDRDINGTLIPSADLPAVALARPAFAFNTTDFFAHGLNVGLDVRY